MTLIPVFPIFTILTLEHKQQLSQALREYQPDNSEFCLGFLYCYQENYQLSVTTINGNICFHGIVHGVPAFLAPIGNNRIADTIAVCLKYLTEKHGQGIIHEAPQRCIDAIAGDARFTATTDRNDSDYIYRVEDLAQLKGAHFQTKRNFVNQFKTRYAYEYLPIDAKLIGQCLELEERWCSFKKCDENISLAMERRCIYRMFQNFETLGLFGAAILIEGKVQAFTISERLNATTAILHIEKANTDFRGIYQAINNLFAINSLRDFTFVNREQDLGDQGLRKAKMSYHPHHMTDKFNIRFAQQTTKGTSHDKESQPSVRQ
jgi:hypothetical protein